MEAAEIIKDQTSEELVNFDTQGNIVVCKETEANAKLVARRAIEAHLERKKMQLDDYWDDMD